MSAGLLLDGLLILIVLLYLPIGVWRGGMRETALGASMLLGAATAIAWAGPWGSRLASAGGMSLSTSEFLAAILTYCAIGLGMGIAAGAIARHAAPDPFGRIAGGSFGLVNIVFALTTLITFVNTFLPDSQPSRTVEESRLAENLVNHQGWILLSAVFVYSAGAFSLRWLLRFDQDVRVQGQAVAVHDGASGRRASSVGLPLDPESGKVEPRTGRSGLDARAESRPNAWIRETRAIVPPVLVSTDLTSPPPSDQDFTGAREQSSTPPAELTSFPRSSTVVDDWLRRATNGDAGPRSADTTPSRSGRTKPHTSANGESPTSFTGAAWSSLLDPVGTRRDREARAELNVTPPDSDMPSGEVTESAEDRDRAPVAGGLPPIRRCEVCGTPAVTGLVRCAFCGSDL